MEKLGWLRLVAITDRRLVQGDFCEAVRQALRGGATAVMLREKDLSGHDLFGLAEKLRMIATEEKAALIVNDRADVALAAGADAVHLGWTSPPTAAIRRAVGGRCKIGFSAHNLDLARQAELEGADYATFSPIFATPSKAGLVEEVGLNGLSEAAGRLAIPLVALGGITAVNARECIAAGAAGVAAIRAIFGESDIVEAARRFRGSMER